MISNSVSMTEYASMKPVLRHHDRMNDHGNQMASQRRNLPRNFTHMPWSSQLFNSYHYLSVAGAFPRLRHPTDLLEPSCYSSNVEWTRISNPMIFGTPGTRRN